jgi:ligand-binding SRPBCC domain-containing protein
VNIYEKASLIECSVEDLFNFHIDMNNLKAITPSNMKVTLLNESFVPKEGGVLRLKTVKNFIPTTWEVQINKLEEPNLLVDVAIKSPFKFWRHSHIFTQVDSRFSEMKDVVEYTLPFGFLNSLLNIIVKSELQSMFNHRHNITKQILENSL